MAPLTPEKRKSWEAYVDEHTPAGKKTPEQLMLYKAAIKAEGIAMLHRNAANTAAATKAGEAAKAGIKYLNQGTIDGATRKLYREWQKNLTTKSDGSIGVKVGGQSPMYGTSQKSRGRKN